MNNLNITLKNINSVLSSNQFDDKTKIELLKEAVKVLERKLNNVQTINFIKLLIK